MRLLIAALSLLTLGALAETADAGCYGHNRGHYHRGHYPYRAVRHAYRAVRHYRHASYYRRAYYPSSSYYGYGRGHYGRYRHYRSYCYDGHFSGWSYGGHVYYGFNPHIRVAPIYGRLSTVFTLDDAVFDGAETSDADGLPQRRTKPVGSRFLQ